MTDRDLGALLERASEHLPEVDFATGAWSAAVAEQARRRRLTVGTLGAVAAAGLAVAAVQLGGSPTPKPSPANSTTTTSAPKVLSDGTAYDEMPLEGKESQLAHFDAGLPSVIDPRSGAAGLSTLASPMKSVVAVYLRQAGEVFHPVMVTSDGKKVIADMLELAPTHDAGGNEGWPLGPRAIGGGGKFVAFAQPGKVVLLNLYDGNTRSVPVPSQTLEWVGWTMDQNLLVARSADHAWTIDPWKSDAKAVAADGAYEGLYRLTSDTTKPEGFHLHRYRNGSPLDGESSSVRGPVYELSGETMSTERRAATGAFFDQNVTSKVIDRGNGPIYQGLVTVDTETNLSKVLLAPENPDGQTGRFKGCCTVLGWADGQTILFRSDGSGGSWILTWNVETGTVLEASRINVDPASTGPFGPIALNVGSRS
jgi:hypothetical protein